MDSKQTQVKTEQMEILDGGRTIAQWCELLSELAAKDVGLTRAILEKLGPAVEQALVVFLRQDREDLDHLAGWAVEVLGEIGSVSDATLEYLIGIAAREIWNRENPIGEWRHLGEAWAEMLVRVEKKRGLQPFRDEAIKQLVGWMTKLITAHPLLVFQDDIASEACALALLAIEPRVIAECLIAPETRVAMGGILRSLVPQSLAHIDGHGDFDVRELLETLAKAAQEFDAPARHWLAVVIVEDLELDQCGDEELELLMSLLKHETPCVRAFAVHAVRYACLGSAESIHEIRQLANDHCTEVRNAVASAIEESME